MSIVIIGGAGTVALLPSGDEVPVTRFEITLPKSYDPPPPNLKEILRQEKNPLIRGGGAPYQVAKIMKAGGKFRPDLKHKRIGAHVPKHPRNQRKGR